MTGTESIYSFTDAVDFLNFEFESRRLKNNRFSLRAWSRQLGYENPSYLSHLLKKERRLKLTVAERFISNLKLSKESKKYFELLVLLQNSKTVDEKHLYMELLDSLRIRKEKASVPLSLEAFRIISEWYHTAILEMIELKDFENNPRYISKRLGDEIAVRDIEKAIERLLKLELIEKTASGKLKRVQDSPFFLENHVPSDAIRHFHQQMMEKAKEAIAKQPMEERDIRGSTITICKKDYKKVQEIIQRAHAELVQYSSQGDGEELYQFNTQFFRLTKKKRIYEITSALP